MRYLITTIALILGISVLAAGQPDTSASGPQTEVVLISVEGAISPATTNYILRGIKKAEEQQAEALIVQLDTPGGLLESTKDIVQAFLSSHELPIIVYVAPEGGRAASAGTYITMAAHIAVMAPTTTIGAASPVQMGGAQVDSVMKKKIFNYSESFIESIAKRRDRNIDWAISAVQDGEAITAEEALELNVVDYVASSRNGLLDQIDSQLVEGDTLHTSNASITEVSPNLAERFLGFTMQTEVMLILTMIAIYGIIGEVTNPGAIVPGVSGVIALILVLYASATMPINVAGFVLIGLAIVLYIAEAFTPTFGILITGGTVSFFLGALMLFQDLPESMELSWAWLIPSTILTALFFIWIATEGIRVQFTSNITGKESMVGQEAKVINDIDSEGGRIFINGEYWNEVSEKEFQKGEYCEVQEIDGLTIRVR